MTARTTNTLGIVSFILAIVAVPTVCFWPLAVLALLAAVLAGVALRREPRSLAIAALTISVLVLIGAGISAVLTTSTLYMVGEAAVVEEELQTHQQIMETRDALRSLPSSVHSMRDELRFVPRTQRDRQKEYIDKLEQDIENYRLHLKNLLTDQMSLWQDEIDAHQRMASPIRSLRQKRIDTITQALAEYERLLEEVPTLGKDQPPE